MNVHKKVIFQSEVSQTGCVILELFRSQVLYHVLPHVYLLEASLLLKHLIEGFGRQLSVNRLENVGKVGRKDQRVQTFSKVVDPIKAVLITLPEGAKFILGRI